MPVRRGNKSTRDYLHNPSIKHKRQYAALRRKGYSKTKAARISNAWANPGLRRKVMAKLHTRAKAHSSLAKTGHIGRRRSRR